MSERLIGTVAYLTVMTLWIYGIVDRDGFGSNAWLLPVLGLVQIAAGFIVGRWGAVLLPLLLVPISVPAMDPPITPDNAEPFPIFVTIGFLMIFAVPLVAGGLGLRMVYDLHSGTSRLRT